MILCELKSSTRVPDVLSHCICTLLYTGSFVLQIDESPVCSLDKVPQSPACDWLLACLQVTLLFCKIHQSATSSMLSILSINQISVFFFLLIHFKSWITEWFQLFLTCLCVFCIQTVQNHIISPDLSLLLFFLFNHFDFLQVLRTTPTQQHKHTH